MKFTTMIKISVFVLTVLAHSDVGIAQTSPDDSDTVESDKKARKQRPSRKARKLAKKKFKQGMELVRKQRYDEAIEALRSAYELGGQPAHLFNLGAVARLSGDDRAAHDYFQKYLAEAPRGKLARTAKKNAAELKKKVDEDDERIARENALRAEKDQANKNAEAARRDAQEAKRAELDMQQKTEAALARSEKEARAAKRERDRVEAVMRTGRGSGKRMIGTSLLVAGGLAVGGAVFSGLDARSANNQLDGLGEGDVWNASKDWLHDRGESSNRRMLVLSITGAVFVAGGATLYYLGDRDARKPLPKERAAVSVRPAVGLTSASVEVAGRF